MSERRESNLHELEDFLKRDLSKPGTFRLYIVSVDPESAMEEAVREARNRLPEHSPNPKKIKAQPYDTGLMTIFEKHGPYTEGNVVFFLTRKQRTGR